MSSTKKQRILVDVGGTLRLDPPDGYPSSATLVITSPDGTELVASTAGTIKTATSLTSAVTGGSDQIPCGQEITSYYPGDWIWVGAYTTGTPEIRAIRSISDQIVTLNERLRYDHASGDPVSSASITYALGASDSDTVDTNYRVVWSYTVNGVATQSTQLFDIVKQIFRLPITNVDLQTRLPESLRRSASSIWDMRELVEVAEDMVRSAIEQEHGKQADLVRNPGQFAEAGIRAVKAIMLDRIAASDDKAANRSRMAYEDFSFAIDNAMRRIDWYDTDDDLIVSEPDDDGTGEEEGLHSPVYFGRA